MFIHSERIKFIAHVRFLYLRIQAKTNKNKSFRFLYWSPVGLLVCSVSSISVFTMWKIALNQGPRAVRHKEQNILIRDRLFCGLKLVQRHVFAIAFRLLWMRYLFTKKVRTTNTKQLYCELVGWPVWTRLLSFDKNMMAQMKDLACISVCSCSFSFWATLRLAFSSWSSRRVSLSWTYTHKHNIVKNQDSWLDIANIFYIFIYIQFKWRTSSIGL